MGKTDRFSDVKGRRFCEVKGHVMYVLAQGRWTGAQGRWTGAQGWWIGAVDTALDRGGG